MTWRKWLVRGLVFSILGGLLLAGVLYQVWTNPAAMRRQVLDKFGLRFPGALVTVESAHLRLLGGIAVSELRMARRDDLDKLDFLYVPSAVIFHDKEHLLEGTLGVCKVEFSRPRVRLVRQRDGRCNLSGLLGPTSPTERMPTLVFQQGTLVIEDRAAPAGTPVLEIHDVNLTVINDPLPLLVIRGTGQTDVAGPVRLSGRVLRKNGAGTLDLDLPALPVGPALVQCLSAFCPDLAVHLRQLKADAALHATLAYAPDSARPFGYDVSCHLQGGTLSHARLPLPLEQVEASARCVNGTVPFARLTARSGPTRLELTVKDLVLPTQIPASVNEVAGDLDAQIEHLTVSPELFAHLPDRLQWMERDYAPVGPVSLTCHYRHLGTSPPQQRCLIRPEGVRAQAVWFPYPADQVAGTIEVESGPDGPKTTVHLTGRAGDRPISLTGTVLGVGPGCGVDLDLRGDNIPLDDRLWEALPHRTRTIALPFLPERSRTLGLHAYPIGKADIRTLIYRPRGQSAFANRYLINFHDMSLCYDVFPYPLENVSGLLDIRPDHWECKDFRGTHRGGEIRVDGRSYALPAPVGVGPHEVGGGRSSSGTVDRVQVDIRGRDVLLDADFERALAPAGQEGRSPLRRAWQMLALTGRMNFAAGVVDHPGQPQDIDVGVDIHGCTMQPTFFPYALDQVSARVRYARGRVYLSDVRARHGPAVLSLDSGLVTIKPGGGFQAWLQPIRATHLTPDDAFLTALSPSLRRGLEPLRLHEPLDVETTLTLDAGPQPGGVLKVWWDGGAVLHNTTLQAGVELTGVNGFIACHGHHDGQQFQLVAGDILLEQATLLGQPLKNVHARLEVLPDTPDVVRLRDLKADLFGGTVGGQARLECGPTLHYELLLEALQVQLDQFGRHNLGSTAQQGQLQGPARAALYLTGEGTDLSGLKGNGRVDVTQGKMGRLPLLLDLLKALGGWAPDRTAFEQAHMIFAIEGPQVRVEELDLLGNAVSLRGQGTIDLDGSNINLDFSADWGRVPQVLPSGVKEIPQAISDQLLKIKMRGTLGKDGSVRFEKELVPNVVEPIKRAFGSGP